MSLTNLRRDERSALCSTLGDVGPDAPTLCGEWRSSDLAGHLVVSEAYRGWPMVAAYGLRSVLPAGITRRAMRSLQSVGDRQIRRAKTRGWSWLLDRLVIGPPPAYDRPGVAGIRLIEEWIHHEDLRRANGMGPRPGSAEMDEALWLAALQLTGFSEFLPGREGIQVTTTGGRTHVLGGNPRVSIEGRPGELLLFLAGRAAADVTVRGDESDIRALRLAV